MVAQTIVQIAVYETHTQTLTHESVCLITVLADNKEKNTIDNCKKGKR